MTLVVVVSDNTLRIAVSRPHLAKFPCKHCRRRFQSEGGRDDHQSRPHPDHTEQSSELWLPVVSNDNSSLHIHSTEVFSM